MSARVGFDKAGNAELLFLIKYILKRNRQLKLSLGTYEAFLSASYLWLFGPLRMWLSLTAADV